jgi:hypothetical protein
MLLTARLEMTCRKDNEIKVVAVKKYGSCALLLVSVLLFLPKDAYACAGLIPTAEIIPTRDGRFLLVTIQADNSDKRGLFEFHNEIALKNKYSQPGLYWVNDPLKPVWTMGFEKELPQFSKFIAPSELYTSADGQYLVAVTEANIRKPLLFYREGKLIKSYSYSEVEADTSMGADCRHEWLKEVRFDQAAGVLIVEHLNGSNLSFDIYTGEQLSVIAGIESSMPIWVGSGFLLWGVFCLYLWRKRLQQKHT